MKMDVKSPLPANRGIDKLLDALRSFISISIVWLILIIIFRILEISIIGNSHNTSLNIINVAGWSLWSDFIFWLKGLLPLFIIYVLLSLISTHWAKLVLKGLVVVFFVVHASLSFYFNTALSLPGADLFSYSKNDIIQTVGASGDLNVMTIGMMVLLIAVIIMTFRFMERRLRAGLYLSAGIIVTSLLFIVLGYPEVFKKPVFNSSFENDLAINKSDYFYTASFAYVFPKAAETDIYADSYIGEYGGVQANAIQFEYNDNSNFPFLHKEVTEDVLSPFFAPQNAPPNIVILLIEGLGRAYSNEGAYLGSFTPFLDSLSTKSLYWENFLSQGGRTFAVLPSLLGSLPFSQNGFAELGNNMPEHLSLLNLLKFNGYRTAFYYGGNGDFDNMNMYLKKNGIDEIMDQKSFSGSYTKLPAVNGFTWGYNDKELFRHYLATTPNAQEDKPQVSVILTVSTHNPFIINESTRYLKLFEERLAQLRLGENQKTTYRSYQNQYASIMYADDAIRDFITAYSKRSDYGNTIFVITGDHRIPEIPMRTKIDRYHVPLIIYSPLLKRTARISSVSTHFDLTPSILSYLKKNHKIRTPEQSSWMGQGLDTSRSFQNVHAVPFMQNKSDIIDFIRGEYHLNGDVLYKLTPDLNEIVATDPQMKEQLINSFNQFKKRNAMISEGKKIIPDSLLRNYTKPD